MSSDEFTRELGFLEATAIGLGTMIGGGIFLLPSIAAAQAGPASAVAFALAGVVSLFSALSHAEIASDMQNTEGGGYEYVTRGLGPMVGTVVGIGMWAGLMFASAFYAVGFAQYLQYFVSLPIAPLAVVLVLALVGLNYYGASEAGWLQDALVASLLVLLVGFVAAGTPAADVGTLRPFNPYGWTAVLVTTGTIYVSFIGFALIATAAAEIERPGRNLPLSMVAAVVVATVVYVAVMLVSTAVVPADRLAGSTMPLADVAGVVAGGLGAAAMVLGAAVATVSSANASILAAGRVSYAMASEDALPAWLRRVHQRYGTPHRAVVLTGVGIVMLAVVRLGIGLLAEVASFTFLLSYGLVNVALVRLRHTDDAYDPEFEMPTPLYPVAPVAGAVATAAIMTQMKPLAIAAAAGIALFGAVWHVVVDGSPGDPAPSQ